jgi:queuosine precursor transporter
LQHLDFSKRKDIVFLVLAGFFVTNAIVAELIGGKLVRFFDLFTQSLGIILWPVVFVLTDLINEHYGRNGVRRLTYITVGLIAYTFVLISVGIKVPAVPFSPVDDHTFNSVFGQSRWIIVGSIVAFFISQLVDVYIFWLFRRITGGKYIWLRATGSTAVSQLVDTFVVQFIAFVIPAKWTITEFLQNASWGYGFKLLVAVAMTPFIYLGHYLIRNLLHDEGKEPL